VSAVLYEKLNNMTAACWKAGSHVLFLRENNKINEADDNNELDEKL